MLQNEMAILPTLNFFKGRKIAILNIKNSISNTELINLQFKILNLLHY